MTCYGDDVACQPCRVSLWPWIEFDRILHQGLGDDMMISKMENLPLGGWVGRSG